MGENHPKPEKNDFFGKSIIMLQKVSPKLLDGSDGSTVKFRQLSVNINLLTFEKISKFQNLILRIPSRFIFDTESYKTL